MAIYRIKRFTENQQESHTGRNLLLGAGLTAGALFAGKRGLLGTGAQSMINKGWTRAGKMVGSQSMMKSGSRGVANAEARNAYNAAVQEAGGQATGSLANKNMWIGRQTIKNQGNYMNSLNTPPSA